MDITDCIASSKGGINLSEIKNKALTDGEACVNTQCAQKNVEGTFFITSTRLNDMKEALRKEVEMEQCFEKSFRVYLETYCGSLVPETAYFHHYL